MCSGGDAKILANAGQLTFSGRKMESRESCSTLRYATKGRFVREFIAIDTAMVIQVHNESTFGNHA
jgi:hypothetical protein